jgi:hypothetical protein
VPDPDADYLNLTVAQWDKLKAPICSVSANNSKTDTGISLTAGQKVQVVPHPTDTWSASFNGNKDSYDWHGDGRFRFARGDLYVMELGMYLDTAKKRSIGVITGPGRLFLGPNDPFNFATGGAIRVKLLPVDE